MGSAGQQERSLLVPVAKVRWIDCDRVSRGLGLALPTEAQWEYACRAGTTTPYAGTGDLDEMGWYGENSGRRVHRVGLKLPNDFGMHDMHGNVQEWCRDYSEAYTQPVDRGDGERRHGSSKLRVNRGGSYRYVDQGVRSSSRNWHSVDFSWELIGVRPAARVTR